VTGVAPWGGILSGRRLPAGHTSTIGRPQLLQTAPGSRPEAFGPVEWGLLVACAAIWGSSFLWIEVGLESLRPTVVTVSRIALGTLALALVPRARRCRIARADWARIVLLAFVWMAVPLTLFPVAQRWIDSSLAGMLNGAVPLTTALVAVLLLRALPGRVQLAGLVVGFGGVVMIAWPELSAAGTTALGVVLVIVAVFCYGVGANIAVPLQHRYGALPVLLRAAMVALVVTVPAGVAGIPGSELEARPLLAMLPLGLLGTGWAYVAFALLLGRAGASRGAVAIYFTPLVAIVLGVVVRGEEVAAVSVVGAALVIAGAWLTSRREVDQAPAPAEAVPAEP
jgi:drug/metabolite transporter (DMT)-like permease